MGVVFYVRDGDPENELDTANQGAAVILRAARLLDELDGTWVGEMSPAQARSAAGVLGTFEEMFLAPATDDRGEGGCRLIVGAMDPDRLAKYRRALVRLADEAERRGTVVRFC